MLSSATDDADFMMDTPVRAVLVWCVVGKRGTSVFTDALVIIERERVYARRRRVVANPIMPSAASPLGAGTAFQERLST